MIDLFLPATDGGAFAQFGAVVLAGAVAVWFLRRRSEWRVVAAGVTLILLGLMGLRALH